MDMRLEVVVIPVSDVDRAKAFYQGLGWRLDADFATGPDFRVVQVTPPGSACAVIFGTGITSAAPGSAEGLQLVAEDIDAARAELAGHGVDVSEVFHDAGGVFHHAGTAGRVAGPAPEHQTYGSWVSFADPDGNSWFVQEVTTRLPGRATSRAGGVRLGGRAGGRAAPGRGGARQVRAGDRQARPGLAGLVRPVHGGRGGGREGKRARANERLRLRRDRAGGRLARRALRRGAGRRRPQGRRGRAGAGRGRVLLLRLHPVQDPAAPGRGRARRDRGGGHRAGGRHGRAGLPGLHGLELLRRRAGAVAGGQRHRPDPRHRPAGRPGRGRGGRPALHGPRRGAGDRLGSGDTAGPGPARAGRRVDQPRGDRDEGGPAPPADPGRRPGGRRDGPGRAPPGR